MLWRFVRKELLTNIRTLRLAVALIFTVLLSVMTTVTGSIDFERNHAVYRESVRCFSGLESRSCTPKSTTRLLELSCLLLRVIG